MYNFFPFLSKLYCCYTKMRTDNYYRDIACINSKSTYFLLHSSACWKKKALFKSRLDYMWENTYYACAKSLLSKFPNMWTGSLCAWRSVWWGWRTRPRRCYREGMVMRVTMKKMHTVRPQRATDRGIWWPGNIVKTIIQMARGEMSGIGRQVPCGAKSLNRLKPQSHTAPFSFHSSVLEPDFDCRLWKV